LRSWAFSPHPFRRRSCSRDCCLTAVHRHRKLPAVIAPPTRLRLASPCPAPLRKV
jgi:hypothetical protein